MEQTFFSKLTNSFNVHGNLDLLSLRLSISHADMWHELDGNVKFDQWALPRKYTVAINKNQFVNLKKRIFLSLNLLKEELEMIFYFNQNTHLIYYFCTKDKSSLCKKDLEIKVESNRQQVVSHTERL